MNMNMNMDYTYTSEQLTAALRLGRAFRHGWALRSGEVIEQAITTGRPITTDLIVALYRAMDAMTDSPFVGIDAPTVIDDNVVVTTANGRFSWTIDRDGNVIATVSHGPIENGEPFPIFVIAACPINRDDRPAIDVVCDGQHIELRHILAAHKMLRALMPAHHADTLLEDSLTITVQPAVTLASLATITRADLSTLLTTEIHSVPVVDLRGFTTMGDIATTQLAANDLLNLLLPNISIHDAQQIMEKNIFIAAIYQITEAASPQEIISWLVDGDEDYDDEVALILRTAEKIRQSYIALGINYQTYIALGLD